MAINKKLKKIEKETSCRIATLVSPKVYISPSAQIMKGSDCGIHTGSVITVGCIIPAGTKVKSGEVYDRRTVGVNDLLFDSEEWVKKLNETSRPHTPTPIDGKTYNFDDVM